jgi:hypothetical protein
MKIDLKVIVVLVLIIAITIWAVNAIRPRSFSGDHLTFAPGSGTVTITNPSDTSIAVLLTGSGSRTYNLTSNIDGVSGRSTREGSGRSATQSFAFELPPGSSEFSIENGVDTIFAADTDTQLSATVQPLSASATRNSIIVLILAIAGSLYYISSSMNHRWIGVLRGEAPVEFAPLPKPAYDAAHGRPSKGFGDNITRKSY